MMFVIVTSGGLSAVFAPESNVMFSFIIDKIILNIIDQSVFPLHLAWEGAMPYEL